MYLTRETQYALHGLIALARRPRGAVVPLAELAEEEALPGSFLAKIFQKLSRRGVLTASRGPGSGYSLNVSPETLPVLEVVHAVEGSDYLGRCPFWGRQCGAVAPCLLHDRWQVIQPQVEKLLRETTLADLAVADASRVGDRSAVAPGGARRARGGAS